HHHNGDALLGTQVVVLGRHGNTLHEVLHLLLETASLKSGMVMTVEPGIYFIPDLIRRWQAEGRHTDFIQYERFLDYERFGGMRVEDVILLGDKSASILGPNIPKQLYEVEEAMS
ncbi:M24 family metallopeptidase, partial [Pseudomonas helleri]|uniref:M24 family metallopeptidase n=1 Tax=Pseudomonas helleri TaxID=1608996 RepID=UPI003FCF01ED